MNRKGTLIILVIFNVFNTLKSQENKKWEDSIALSYLQKNEYSDKIGIIRDTINGKIVISKNYYCYESFMLKIDETSKIYLINFGTFITESPIYVAVLDESNNKKKIFILGEKEFEKDLEQLNDFFKSKMHLVKEEYKIEIVDLFLRCRRGQRKTPIYLH